jgi:hypothetical protein
LDGGEDIGALPAQAVNASRVKKSAQSLSSNLLKY